jgi:hypothetical protein
MLITALVILIIGVIFIFLIPFIKTSFANPEDCFDVQYKLELIDSRFSCSDSDLQLSGLAVKSFSDKIKKFRIAFYDSSGISTIFDVSNGLNPQGFAMLGEFDQINAGTSQIIVPNNGQQLIYIVSGNNFVRADISPIVKKTICPTSSSKELHSCSNSVNLNFVPGNIDILAKLV